MGDVVSAARLEGNAVRGTDGGQLGRVRHVVLDLSSGRIAFLVMDVTGLDRRLLCAVPWIAFGPQAAEVGLVLSHTAEDLRNAPTFAADDWPSFGDPQWLHAVYRFFCPPAFSPLMPLHGP